MIRPKVLLFDLDGTLVDSLDDIATSANLARVEFGLPPLPPEAIKRLVGDGAAALVQQVVPVPAARQPDALAAFLRHYDTHLVDATRFMPGVEDVLARFADRDLAVITNKLLRFSERTLSALGVRDQFRLVLGGDSLPTRKPDPAPLLHALTVLGCAPGDAVMIGDGINDVKAAQAAGVTAIAVTGGVATREELAALRPDYLVEGMTGLTQILA